MFKEIFFLFSIYLQGLKGDIEYDNRLQIKLEHCLSSSIAPDFEFRGEINLKSLHTGVVSTDQIQLTKAEITALENLARQDESYRLRVTVKTPDGRQNIFHTFTSACALLSSKLHDVLFINVDHVGNVVAVTLSTTSSCSPSEIQLQNREFITNVYVRHMDIGPVPDTASYVQKLEKERESKERGETKDNRSFLAKYWMYIVPAVVFVLISSASNPEGADGGQ